MTYKVFIDDNFHYMDESERYALGEFRTRDAAIEASKKIVDEYLLSAQKPGISAQDLYGSYTLFGEDPFIIAEPSRGGEILFSAWDYARRRCNELCNPVEKEADGPNQET